jgi:hypothetical protein
MSQSGLRYTLNETIGNNKGLLIHYEFSGMSGRHIGNIEEEGDDATLNYAVFENDDPSIDTGLYSGIVTMTSDSADNAKLYLTGTILADNNFNLEKSNIKVTSSGASHSIDFSNVSSLIDFQFDGKVSDSVLFGALDKISTTVGGVEVTGAKGYNFGVNSRGKLFYQGFDGRGDFIHTANSIELSKRNLVGFSIGQNAVSISRFDYTNNNIETEDFFIQTNYISKKSENFYLGGSPQYYKPEEPSGEYRNATGIRLNSFVLYSGYMPPSVGLNLGSGLLGTYFKDDGTTTFKKIVTGYNQTTTYMTGITGYEYDSTGTFNVSTGTDMYTGQLVADGNLTKEEGELYFQYQTYSLSGITTFNKEQIGFLHPDSGYQYMPTGEGAFATLGLREVEGNVAKFIERSGFSGAATVGVTLKGVNTLTGTLSDVSGVVQEPLFQTVVDRPAVPSSGIDMSLPSDLLKKNYIYYMGVRK